MKKGQLEIIGLVIIVVLLLIGALFYLRFGVLNPQPTFEQNTIRVNQAYNLMNALTNIKLCDKKLSEAIVSCKEGTGEYCEGKDACTYLKEQLPKIADPIFHDTIGTDYSFEAKRGEDVFLNFGDCKVGQNSPPLRISSNGKTYLASFKLCPFKE